MTNKPKPLPAIEVDGVRCNPRMEYYAHGFDDRPMDTADIAAILAEMSEEEFREMMRRRWAHASGNWINSITEARHELSTERAAREEAERELAALRPVVDAANETIASFGKIQKRTPLHDALAAYTRFLAEKGK